MKRKDFYGKNSATEIKKKKKLVWTVEIHHFDVGQGDSTLILTKQGKVLKRSMLVDGGDYGWGKTIYKNLINLLGKNRLDTMVITHYDEDHFYGAAELLGMTDCFASDFQLFDQGIPADERQEWWVKPKDIDLPTDKANRRTAQNPDGDGDMGAYLLYEKNFKALQSNQSNVTRVTVKVDAEEIVKYAGFRGTESPELPKRNGMNPANHLLRNELLWFGKQKPIPAPKVTCLAANKWIATKNDKEVFRPPRRPACDVIYKNGKENVIYYRHSELDSNNQSLALLLELDAFRYFMAGDLTRVGEDTLAEFLNPNQELSARVHALKVSHHGSAGASSKNFLERMMPQLGFISVGKDNSYKLPSKSTLARLDDAKNENAKWAGLECYFATTSGRGTGKKQQKSSDDRRIGGHIVLTLLPDRDEMVVSWKTGKILKRTEIVDFKQTEVEYAETDSRTYSIASESNQ